MAIIFDGKEYSPIMQPIEHIKKRKLDELKVY